MAQSALKRASLILAVLLLMGLAIALFLTGEQPSVARPDPIPRRVTTKPVTEETSPAPKTEEKKAAAAPAVEHCFDFKTPESYARFRALFNTRLSFGTHMQYEQGRLVFRRAAEKSERPEDGMHLQADTLALGNNWDMHARVDLRIGVSEVEAGTKAKHSRRADFHMRFMEAGEKPRDDCDSHYRFCLGVLAANGGFLTCALRGHRQLNDGEGRAPGAFAGIANPGIFGEDYLRKGRVRPPASADGKYDVRLSMRGDQMIATLGGQLVFHTTLLPPAVELIAKGPPAFYFGCSNETREIYLDELRLRILPPQPEEAIAAPIPGMPGF